MKLEISNVDQAVVLAIALSSSLDNLLLAKALVTETEKVQGQTEEVTGTKEELDTLEESLKVLIEKMDPILEHYLGPQDGDDPIIPPPNWNAK